MMTNPFHDLPSTLDQVWSLCEDGQSNRTSAFRTPVLATNAPDGPSMRSVVLRGVDRTAQQLTSYTDTRSSKVDHLRADPRCALHFWDAAASLQVRITARATVAEGDVLTPLWNTLPSHARALYGGSPAPGATMPSAETHDPTPDPAQFCVLTLTVLRVETLLLARDLHRRARFDAALNWRGEWLAP